MDRREERRAGMSRLGTLQDEDGSFDREFWARILPAERLALVWDMALEAQEWRREGAGQSRLQRSDLDIWTELTPTTLLGSMRLCAGSEPRCMS